MVNNEADLAPDKLQVVKYSETGFGLQFLSSEVEKVYRDEASKALYKKVKHVRTHALVLSLAVTAVIAVTSRRVQLFSGSLWDSTLRFEPIIAVDLAFALYLTLLVNDPTSFVQLGTTQDGFILPKQISGLQPSGR